MHDPQEDAPSILVENEEVIPQDNGSDLLDHGHPMEKNLQDSQLHRSKCEAIPCRHFKIEGEACMIAQSDDAEPKTIKQTLSSPTSKEWSVAMQDEMESMRTNHV